MGNANAPEQGTGRRTLVMEAWGDVPPLVLMHAIVIADGDYTVPGVPLDWPAILDRLEEVDYYGSALRFADRDGEAVAWVRHNVGKYSRIERADVDRVPGPHEWEGGAYGAR